MARVVPAAAPLLPASASTASASAVLELVASPAAGASGIRVLPPFSSDDAGVAPSIVSAVFFFSGRRSHSDGRISRESSSRKPGQAHGNAAKIVVSMNVTSLKATMALCQRNSDDSPQ